MLPVKHLTQQILMAVDYCGSQLACRLGWVAPAYLSSPHSGACKHGLQYLRPDGCGLGCGIFKVWVEGEEKFVLN